MGEVYRARDTQLNRDVAIMVVRPALTDDPDRRARFGREAHIRSAPPASAIFAAAPGMLTARSSSRIPGIR
jgi:serine/threonine-protein kinase